MHERVADFPGDSGARCSGLMGRGWWSHLAFLGYCSQVVAGAAVIEGPWGLDVQDDVLPWLAVGAEATDGGTYTLRVACVGLSCRALFQEPWRPREAASFLLT